MLRRYQDGRSIFYSRTEGPSYFRPQVKRFRFRSKSQIGGLGWVFRVWVWVGLVVLASTIYHE